MAIVCHYRLRMVADRDEEARSLLSKLAELLRSIDGFEEALLLQDTDEPAVYLFSERWSSFEAYRKGQPLLPKTLFASLIQTLAAPLESARFISILLDADR